MAVYLADTGLLTVLGQVSSGQRFENAIAVQLARLGEVSYYQRRTQPGRVDSYIAAVVSRVQSTEYGIQRISTYK